MAMSRSLGWTLLTTRSPMEIVPEVIFSSPASIRNRVDLPQPEGPTSTTKAPSSIGIVTPCKTSKPPNDFLTSRICTDDMKYLPSTRPVRWQMRDRLDLIGSYQTFSIESLDQSRRYQLRLRTVAKPAVTCEHRLPTQRLRTRIRRVRCGRTPTHE